jgi:hypothetical protein
MKPEELTEAIGKALEVWSLQTLLDVAILAGILATGLAMIQPYYQAMEKRLSLRVSIETWRVLSVLVVDLLLAFTVLIGYLVLNPDIMSDIKVAVPFCPVATLLFTAALVLRLFHGGHEVGSKNYFRSLGLMLGASLVNMAGFTFVMEAASPEYLGRYPSDFWKYLREHLRSNADPAGIDFSHQTFLVCFPLLLAVLAWGAWSGWRRISRPSSTPDT